MPRFGFDDERVVKTAAFPICFPPVRSPELRPWLAELGTESSALARPERGSANLMVELGSASLDRLVRLEAVIHDIAAKMNQIQQQHHEMTTALAELRELAIGQRTIKDWYSPEQLAEILGKQPYTVREWCRYQRINARKRPTGRGDAKEWEISHEEMERIKSHGLLPMPAKY
jgi:hypothetical protein